MRARSPLSTASVERRLAEAALVTALLCVVALHTLQPELDPLRRFLSEHALGPWGALMRIAFFALALAGGIQARMRWRARERVVALGLGGWTLGMAVAGAFVTDSSLPDRVRTTSGVVHDVAADAAFVSLIVAQIASSVRGRVLAALMTVSVLAANAVELHGLGQRVFAALAIGWQAIELRATDR